MKALDIEPKNQRFRIVMEGVEYSALLRWNHRAACWVCDLSTLAGAEIVSGVALVISHTCLGHMALKVGDIIAASQSGEADATFDTLGSDVDLLQLTEADRLALLAAMEAAGG